MKCYRLHFILALLLLSFSLVAQDTENESTGYDENPLAQIDVDRESFEIYPNPAADYVNIVINEPELTNVNIALYDIIGNRIETSAQKIETNKYRIELRELPMGYYVVIIDDPSSRFKTAYKFSKR